MNQEAAVQIVKQAVRVTAIHICWPQPGVIDNLKKQEAAKKALEALPMLNVPSHPYYPSTDEGQSGFVLAAHLTDDQMVSVPQQIVIEMLDELASCAGGVCRESPRESQRNQLLASYGPELAEIICKGIDEGLESRTEGHKRLRDWDGVRFAPLHSTELDEPIYEDCSPDAEHASPTTSFDFWAAIGEAAELIERRDEAAAAARRGDIAAPEAVAA